MAPNAPGLAEELETTSFNVCHKAEKARMKVEFGIVKN